MDSGSRNETILLTGASGFLGRTVVKRLLEEGYSVRAFQLPGSAPWGSSTPGLEVVEGDVADLASLHPVFEGIDGVIHAAADTSGTFEGGRKSTIQGTQNILALSKSNSVRRLVYISSCSVYGVQDFLPNELVREDAPLERFPELRGPYSWAKFEAEALVRDFMEAESVPIVCLRPGIIYGGGGDPFPPMLGFSMGKRLFAVIGDGSLLLPLVHVEDTAEAIVLAYKSPSVVGGIYNLIDPRDIDKRTYMNTLIRMLYPKGLILYLPYSGVRAAVSILEGVFRILRLKPPLTKYRLVTSQKPVKIDGSRAMSELRWSPRRTFEERVAEALAQRSTSR